MSQNKFHTTFVMPCFSEIVDKSGGIFRIEGPFNLNCNESRDFQYMDKFNILKN
jgi:hypothetical protein